MAGKTLYDKLWEDHVVRQDEDGTALIYIDRHLVHEVTSPQAFEGLHLAGRRPWRTDSVLAVPDHNVPTVADSQISDPVLTQWIRRYGDAARAIIRQHGRYHDGLEPLP